MSKFVLEIAGDKITSEIFGSLEQAQKIVLFCHGFPGTNHLPKLVNSLKKQLIALVNINYRGDKKSGGKFIFLGSINDIKKVANYLKKKYPGKKIYGLGYSMGGFYLANIAKEYINIFDKIILLNAVVNTPALFSKTILMNKLWRSAQKILSLHRREFYRREIGIINKKFNPLDFAEAIKIPIEVIQGAKDKILSPKDARKFYSLLVDVPKKYFLEPQNDHDFWGNEKKLILSIIN